MCTYHIFDVFESCGWANALLQIVFRNKFTVITVDFQCKEKERMIFLTWLCWCTLMEPDLVWV